MYLAAIVAQRRSILYIVTSCKTPSHLTVDFWLFSMCFCMESLDPCPPSDNGCFCYVVALSGSVVAAYAKFKCGHLTASYFHLTLPCFRLTELRRHVVGQSHLTPLCFRLTELKRHVVGRYHLRSLDPVLFSLDRGFYGCDHLMPQFLP